MKTCKICNCPKPESEYYSTGNGYYRLECKSCKTKISQERQSSIKKQFRKWKSTLKCQRCGFDDPRALQFHHPNDDKKDNIGTMIRNCSLSTLMEEAKKCEVLCANCHQIEHAPKALW